MKIDGRAYPYKIRKALNLRGLYTGYFVRLSLKTKYSFRTHIITLEDDWRDKIKQSGFQFISFDERWMYRKRGKNDIAVEGVWLTTEEDLNLFRLMFGNITDREIYHI